MAYLENHMKFVAVLNQGHPLPIILNGVCHATAGLVARIGLEAPDYLPYRNEAHDFESTMSRFPFIVLRSKNSGHLAKLTRATAAAGVECNVFVSPMLGSSAEEQIRNTLSTPGEDLEYIAVVLFGKADTIDPLTKRFSLFGEMVA